LRAALANAHSTALGRGKRQRIFSEEVVLMRHYLISLSCLLVGSLAGAWFIGPQLLGQPAPAVMPKELVSYRDVVKRVLPAVVSIETLPNQAAKSKTKAQPRFDDSKVPPEFRKFFEDFKMPLELPNEAPHHSLGSGFFVDSKGTILTNYHVVKGAEQVSVLLDDGRKFFSKDIKVDPQTDLAVVTIQASEPFPFLELGDSAAMEIGDRVLAVGAPFGFTGSVTAGIISGKSRNVHINKYEDFIQTDAAINPGNSGGPLVTLDGKAIGVNTAIKSSNGGSQGVGLAVTSNLAKNIVQQLLANGVVHRGYLGVQVAALDADVANRLGVADKTGVVIAKVLADSPAAKAGIQAGDVLTKLDQTPIRSGVQLQHKVASLPLQKPVEITVVREGKVNTLQATIEEQPKEFGSTVPLTTPSQGGSEKSTRIERLGVEFGDLMPETASRFGFSEKTTGPVITNVDPDGLAAGAGLKAGTLILKVDNHSVHTAADARAALEKGSLETGVLLQVRSSQGGLGYVMLKAPVGQ
jgi:serine protease Do